jgi:hypothetical protein
MTTQQATQLAQDAIDKLTPGDWQPVADATTVTLNADGTYSVCDNGEEAIATTPEQAIEFIVENLTA